MALTKVTKSGITDNAIDADKIEDGTILDADITPGTITNAKLAGSITNAKLANSSLTINGSSVSLGSSISAGSLNWQAVITADGSTGTTGVAGRGYFIDTTSAAHTFTLPVSAAIGDTIAIKDYAGTFATFNLTIARNGHSIQGSANNSLISTNRASVVLVYVDVTRGWEYVTESNVAVLVPTFISATGGTITTSGDFKIHSFTGDGSFVVSQLGNTLIPSAARDTVDYLVVAGGGGGAARHGGGGGAGGFRESKDSTLSSPHTASPLAATTGITITATSYPITVGAGGAGATSSPTNTGPNTYGQAGNNSIFSTITSTGGGSSGGPAPSPNGQGAGKPGGSGGGASWISGPPQSGGTGNSPPTSPSQGNNGGTFSTGADYIGAGGGGATAAGGPISNNIGGAGATTSISGSPTSYAGGGGGGHYSNSTPDPAAPGAGGLGGGGQGSRGGNTSPTARVVSGTINTGGGGGGGGAECSAPTFVQENGGSGGSGIVVIRYKFQ